MSFEKQTLNYAKQYSTNLAQAYPYVLHFGKLYATPNNGRYRWLNGKTIEIPHIVTSGRTAGDTDGIGAKARREKLSPGEGYFAPPEEIPKRKPLRK